MYIQIRLITYVFRVNLRIYNKNIYTYKLCFFSIVFQHKTETLKLFKKVNDVTIQQQYFN